MGKIKIHEFMTLDGVIENPSWTMDFGFDPKMGETIAGLMSGEHNAILLGRKTFEMFAPAWSTRTAEDDPGAPFFNDSTKYVVGATAPSVEWANSVMLGAYDPAAIQKVKADVPDSIYVSGSAALVQGLLQDGLVDELHLFVYPVTLGRGLRLFTDSMPSHKLSLLESETYANGVVHLAYAQAAATG